EITSMFQDLHEGKLNKAYDKVNWNFMHKRIMLLLKSEIAPVYIFYHLIIVKKYFHGKDLYNIKRPLCTIDPELYEICDDKFILVKDARIKNWQLFDGYQFANGFIHHHPIPHKLTLHFYLKELISILKICLSRKKTSKGSWASHMQIMGRDSLQIKILFWVRCMGGSKIFLFLT
ncbi:hypothetical protein ACJX0J_035351, partial [Zea mays]